MDHQQAQIVTLVNKVFSKPLQKEDFICCDEILKAFGIGHCACRSEGPPFFFVWMKAWHLCDIKDQK